MFLKGRQAGMAEGFRDDSAEVYAMGCEDGTNIASERKEALTEA